MLANGCGVATVPESASTGVPGAGITTTTGEGTSNGTADVRDHLAKVGRCFRGRDDSQPC